jgi:hypothetical protein
MTIAERASSPWRGCHAGQYVVVGVPFLVPGSLGLLLDGEPGVGQPCSDLLDAGVVMVVAVGSSQMTSPSTTGRPERRAAWLAVRT